MFQRLHERQREPQLYTLSTLSLIDWLTDLFCVVENTNPLLNFCILESIVLVIIRQHKSNNADLLLLLIWCVGIGNTRNLFHWYIFLSPQSGQTFQVKLGRRGPGRSRQQRELPQGQPAQREVHWGYDQQQFAAFQQAHADSHQRSEAWEKRLCLFCTHERSWDRNHNGTLVLIQMLKVFSVLQIFINTILH